VPTQSTEDIRDAVRRCLARVSQGKTPLGVIAEFLAELKDQGWDARSRHAVNTTVLKVLSGVVNPGEDFDVLN
jgi:hypothetical protein